MIMLPMPPAPSGQHRPGHDEEDRKTMTRLPAMIVALGLAFALAGCGARGKPEPPPGSTPPDPDREIVLDPLVKAPESSTTATK